MRRYTPCTIKTKPELEERAELLLKSYKLPYKAQVYWSLKANRRHRCDFLICDKIILECDGLQWKGKGRHNTCIGVVGDIDRGNVANDLGMILYRCSNKKGNTDAESVVKKIYHKCLELELI